MVKNYATRTGEMYKSDGTIVNEADGINNDGSQNIRMRGVNVTDYGPVTPNDTTDLSKPCIGICVTGTAGSVSVVKLDDNIVTIPAVMLPIGQIVPLPAKRIRVTNTTATGIWVVH
ncbi:hypothetical protein BK126_04505 [Paenibacillus sp. FSL H7-0326]|uniref:spike base protein, RCAP_Rcc01079 family n=1 Tax=Paenibacillus sp. FSL H7-0326 TaxID=1921144 RepID=UPI00096D0748|nr:hypothetical protein [Paenibacillus sp. FSL H7-0326]OMC71364.1 hypothetical protein BK126_04505 [Paenibacillus sp. FSL H7-0326]